MRGAGVSKDTIAAIATPAGRGGVGIVRISGHRVDDIARTMLGTLPRPRYATMADFRDQSGEIIDQGIALYFKAPHSFTGEHVLELHGHGGPLVMDMLLNAVVSMGARIARPGEFSERAFLNDKIDLSQAEAIADLIDSVSQQAARGAIRSLQGELSRLIYDLNEQVINLRMYVEAAIDFPEEEIDFLEDSRVLDSLERITADLDSILQQASQGAILREGISLVLAGRPNAGKSSLMNQLSGRDTSIVTTVAGTTRDVVNEYIHLDGIPLRLIDTAGLRESKDEVEIEGVSRARREIENADRVLLVVDLTEHGEDLIAHVNELIAELPPGATSTVVLNKADLVGDSLDTTIAALETEHIVISALTGAGIDELKAHLKQAVGYDATTEGAFIARARHVDALRQARQHLETGQQQLLDTGAGELLAEELRYCQQSLSEITGEFTSDDLLGRIFESFCIGK